MGAERTPLKGIPSTQQGGIANGYVRQRLHPSGRCPQSRDYPYFIPLEDTEGTEVVINGKRMIMIGSNNYLGLTTDPRVREAAIDAIRRYGTSCTGSRFLNGNLAMHDELEQELADFVGKEAGLVFSTGMGVNLGVISALVQRGEYVITDRDDHASISMAAPSYGEKRYATTTWPT